MTLQQEQSRHRQHGCKRKAQKPRRRKPYRPPQLALAAPLALDHADQVLSFGDWVRLNRISERTGRRILASGNGPEITMLSERRIGIRVGANKKWQAARARGAQA
jgi:ribosomal protein S8E